MDNEMFFQQIFQLEPIKVNPKKTLLNVRKFSFIFPKKKFRLDLRSVTQPALKSIGMFVGMVC